MGIIQGTEASPQRSPGKYSSRRSWFTQLQDLFRSQGRRGTNRGVSRGFWPGRQAQSLVARPHDFLSLQNEFGRQGNSDQRDWNDLLRLDQQGDGDGLVLIHPKSDGGRR